jgi:valyl-tRNA synthetase
MGQIFWVSYIDIVARYKRMKGFNVLYPQGWDAHGFPTEIAVEKKYGKKMSREEFYKKCTELSEQQHKEHEGADAPYSVPLLMSAMSTIPLSDDYVKKGAALSLQMYDKKMLYTRHPIR